jgi:hypothetical protein
MKYAYDKKKMILFMLKIIQPVKKVPLKYKHT